MFSMFDYGCVYCLSAKIKHKTRTCFCELTRITSFFAQKSIHLLFKTIFFKSDTTFLLIYFTWWQMDEDEKESVRCPSYVRNKQNESRFKNNMWFAKCAKRRRILQ